jgi:hypothetical protein
LKDEPKLKHDILLEIDGNMSQKRFKKAGTSDVAKFTSTYILPHETVDKFAGVAQIRKKAANKAAKKGGEDPEGNDVANEADAQDAELETGREAPETEGSTQRASRHERAISHWITILLKRPLDTSKLIVSNAGRLTRMTGKK